MKNEELLHGKNICDPGDEALTSEQMKCLERLYDFNHTRPSGQEKRGALMREMFAEVGEGEREYYYKDKKIDWESVNELLKK